MYLILSIIVIVIYRNRIANIATASQSTRKRGAKLQIDASRFVFLLQHIWEIEKNNGGWFITD